MAASSEGLARPATGGADAAECSPVSVGPNAPDLPTGPAETAGPAPGPTLDDIAGLTRESDFTRFAGRDVDPQVRNAALRKLFSSDPHFNTMDGLDVYIDDYSQAESIPKAMLRQMVQARSLGLLDDELTDQDKPAPDTAARDLAANDTSPAHEDADLQLQRDAAAGSGRTEPGAGGDGGSAQPERPGAD